MIHVGIDISKMTLDVCMNNKSFKCKNTQSGINRLIQRLPEDVFVIFESTGPYGKLLYKLLCEAGKLCCCANPLNVRRFAQGSLNRFFKNDPSDAEVLAEYGRQVNPQPTQFSNDTQIELEELMFIRDALMKQERAMKNRTEIPFVSKDAERALQRTITDIQKRIKSVHAKIDQFIQKHAIYKQKKELLETIVGVGPITSVALLAYCPELGMLTKKEVASLAGLAPRTKQSGKMRSKEHIGGGRKKLRNSLYMSAISSKKFDSVMRRFYQSLIERGKPSKVALTAVMRKLIIYANSVLRSGFAFEIRDTQSHAKQRLDIAHSMSQPAA